MPGPVQFRVLGCDTFPKQIDGIAWGKNRQQAEASFELGVFLHWLADEFAKPVHEFEPSRTGEAIDGPLGAVAVPFGFLLLDELPLPPFRRWRRADP